MSRVHLNVGRGEPACRAGARWASSVITTNYDHDAVTCLTCRRMLDVLPPGRRFSDAAIKAALAHALEARS